ncbi:hypothetical protein [Pseudomonas graminis]|uniref:hypothetical protein n=1 Tax=Pseudomonas graminis TaxID=158627 RepID=UPI00114CB880|nr:hypothetical protein [Pseudomonas graminis]
MSTSITTIPELAAEAEFQLQAATDQLNWLTALVPPLCRAKHWLRERRRRRNEPAIIRAQVWEGETRSWECLIG